MTYEVTIGIPVYNVEKYIRQTLESALAQTFPSIEFLICDDCGTDSSIAIIKEIQETHPRGKDIRILHQPRNMGIGPGRNRMLDEAKGRFFYSLDGDDTIAPNTIELLYNTANKNNGYHAKHGLLIGCMSVSLEIFYFLINLIFNFFNLFIQHNLI